ncbi:MAG: LysR family transcriptional regulator, partial [Planctomycetes bacterium]|nr:LysR family transcriptional regulator [Planctomycetota bacterium]
MDWLNYHHLYYFWITAREGSMTRAAAKMHVTPATLSVQIRELEKSA